MSPLHNIILDQSWWSETGSSFLNAAAKYIVDRHLQLRCVKKNNDDNNNNISGSRTFSGWPNRRHCDGRPPRPISLRPAKGWTIGGGRRPPRSSVNHPLPQLCRRRGARVSKIELFTSIAAAAAHQSPLTVATAAAASRSQLPCNSSAALRAHSDRKVYLKSANNNNNNGINNIIIVIRRTLSHTAYGFCGLCAPCLDR